MTQEEYYKIAEAFCAKGIELSRRKNNDYADPDSKQGDPFAVFANFTAVERAGICPTETGFLVRMMDKMVRLSNLMRPGHERMVNDESLQDTLQDLHNYSSLLNGYLECKKVHGNPIFGKGADNA